MRPRFALAVLALCVPALPAMGQLALPGVALPQIRPGQVLDTVQRQVDTLERDVTQTATDLAHDRALRLDRLVRKYPDLIERDAEGQPARKGIVLLTDASDSDLAKVRASGLVVLGQEAIAGTGVAVTRIAVPDGSSLADVQRQLAALLPQAEVSADTLYSEAGHASGRAGAAGGGAIATPVGMIDGAPAAGATVATKGFAKGAPAPSNHGSAIASLLRSAGVRTLYAADVYGSDPAGGNALAIARALGWLAQEGARVITISLVGPANPVIARSIKAVRGRGVTVVAAVGNDGPAAPPAYPASYGDVVAVTGVDRRDRALIEAGKALHLDYAAPGADIFARGDKGQRLRLRGTSFAAPLAAARIAAALDRTHEWRALVDREARDLGPKGPDATYGRGLLCAKCGR